MSALEPSIREMERLQWPPPVGINPVRAEIPMTRTPKQPLQGYCLNPICSHGLPDLKFVFPVSDEIECPKCGCNQYPFVGLLALIHWVRPSDRGELNLGGRRMELACDPRRHYISTEHNKEVATAHLEAVNCPGCQKEIEKCHAHS